MKNDACYLGSVRFYKHLILSATVLLFFLPIVGLFFVMFLYGELKQNSEKMVNTQQFHIVQLEEKLAYYEEQLKAKNTNTLPEAKKSENVQQKLCTQELTIGEDTLVIPFEIELDELKYILVNDHQPLPESYQPDLVETKNGHLVHKEIKASLENMINDAKNEGIELIICSAYRDYEKQARLVDNSIKRYMNEGYDYKEAYFKTRNYLAVVGRSEHHTGLAVDLVGISYQALDEGQANTPENKWLNENAHKYGFIVRYPKEKGELTGILHESWHFRYVGEPAAAFIKENQLCLEEFIALAYTQNEIK